MAILSRVMHTSPLADIIDHTATDKRLGNWLPAASPKEVRAYIRDNLETLYHPTSTARMAPLSEGGVVDARLKVHGIHGLRIVDASIFPTIISGHTVRSFVYHLVFCFPSEPLRGFGMPMSTYLLASPAGDCSAACFPWYGPALVSVHDLLLKGKDYHLPYEHTGRPSDRGGGESRRIDCRRFSPVR